MVQKDLYGKTVRLEQSKTPLSELLIAHVIKAVSSRHLMIINIVVLILLFVGIIFHNRVHFVLLLLLVFVSMMIIIFQNFLVHRFRERILGSEEKLHHTMRIYQRMVEQATDIIYIIDLESRIVLLNQPAAEMFANLVDPAKIRQAIDKSEDPSSVDSYKDKRLDEILSYSDSTFIKQKIDRVVEEDSSISFSHSVTANSKKIYFSTKFFPIRNSNEELYLVLGITRDTTEMNLMDQRIYQAEKLASIGTLAAGVAHEINNPLAIILGFTDLLCERFDPSSQVYKDLKMIEDHGKLAQKVVSNLLGFARPTEGMGESVNVLKSIDKVINVVGSVLKTEKVDLITDLPSSVPLVRGDPREFQQVIFNLINNSVAAMNEDKQLSISIRFDDREVLISIKDSGRGIPDKVKPQIFDPFFTTKEIGKGTGLGLSLCYGIVTKYNGNITFDSVSSEDDPYVPTGTTFTISFPIFNPNEEQIQNG